MSGAYIGLELSSEGKSVRKYTGLEIPPVITGKVPGKHFVLHTKNLASIERDVPVYYRKFSVGKVEDVKLNPDGESVSIRIFIQAPYDQWVNSSTRFWNVSGVDFSLTADGFQVDTESLVSILIGGIAFESKDLGSDITQAENNSEFEFRSHADAIKKYYKIGLKYVVNFAESVRGLAVGAPVDFRGKQVGEVTDIQLVYDQDHQKVFVPVTFTIDYGRLAFKGNEESASQIYDSHITRTNIFVKQGLRAQLQTGSLLTGQSLKILETEPKRSEDF